MMNKLSTTANEASSQRKQVEQGIDGADIKVLEARGVAQRLATIFRKPSALARRKRKFTTVKPGSGKVHIIGGDVLIL